MNDGSSTTSAESQKKPKPNGSFSKMSKEYLVQTKDSLLALSAPPWITSASHDGSGILTEPPTSEHRTEENDGFALLPTPTARDYKDAGPNVKYKRIAEHRVLPGVVMHELYDDGKKS